MCRKTIRFAILILLSGLFSSLYAQNPHPPSVLQSGAWFKLSVEKEGVYKINFDLLKKMGIDPGKIDPRKIKIYGNAGGMLPQANSVSRPYDLVQNAIYVSGETDAKFDKQDFILFYAQGPDKVAFETKRGIYAYESNLYGTKNFYFLTIATDDGKRVVTSENLGSGPPVIKTFNDYAYHELDKIKLEDPKSGREWYGEIFGISTIEQTIPFSINGITPGSTLKMVSDVLGHSFTNSSFKLSLNGVPVAEQKLLPIPNTRYGVKGIHKRDTLLINAGDVAAENRDVQEIKYEFVKGQGTSNGYLDFLLLSFERNLALYNDQTIFLSEKSLANAISQFEVSSVPEQSMIWDITDPYNVAQQSFDLSDQTATFSTTTDQLKRFIVFNNKITAPMFVGKVPNQDLHGLNTPNLIIVTHPSFEDEARRLAAHREAFNNWRVEVVTPEQVFNEFSGGRQDVSAIRDFVRLLYNKDPSSLKALLLMGKGSYDYKDRIPNNTNFVITYESRNSLHPLQTFSSDDYFGFLEDSEGNWEEGDKPQNHSLDIGVGRLPVTSSEEAASVVDKLIDYDLNKKGLGYWRKQIVFVADDGNSDDGYSSLHQYQADLLATAIEGIDKGIDTRKLFMGTYTKTVRPNGETIPKLTDDVIRSFDRGSLIINYTGHGSEKQLGDENFFNTVTIGELENKLYPFLVTATCEFGRHDNPEEISGAEKCVTQKNGGAIGLVTTTRPVNAGPNFNLNEAFYNALLQRQNNAYLSMGEVFRQTKNNSISGVSNRNFSLLGDPSFTLALPSNVVHITELKTATGSDTLKALSTVIAKGEVRNVNGEKLTSFNGILEATLFDKETTFTTTGRNNPAFSFRQWSNALFRGKATVTNGEFQFELMLPKNIAYQVNAGKLSLYAFDPASHSDASGYDTDFKIGESETDIIADNSAPEIRLFMGDSTFVNGGITTPDTYLVANLKDNNGINISSYGLGNSIIATLDNDVETFILNAYYVADTDDPSSGWIKYPIKDLAPGRHTLTVKGWDVFNNSAENTVEFLVSDGEKLVIESFGNYPNPFRDNTTLFFTHNRSGDDLQAQVFIQTVTGEVVKSGEILISASDYRVDLMELNSPDDFNKKLSAGLYLARLVVRSLTNGSKNEQVTKLIILN